MNSSKQNGTDFYVTFLSLDKEKSTRFPGIISKLAQQLSQYVEIEQQQFLQNLNKNVREESFQSCESFNIWRFIWNQSNEKISGFLNKHRYIGTKQLRLFFERQQYSYQDFQLEEVQKMQIYNVPRLSSHYNNNNNNNADKNNNNNNNIILSNNNNNNNNWKLSKQESTNSQSNKLSRNTSKQESYKQEQLPDPQTYEEYEKAIQIMQEKIQEAKTSNKELKETNYVLGVSIQNLEITVAQQQQVLDKVQEMVQVPLDQLIPPQEKQNDQQDEDDEQQEESNSNEQDQKQQSGLCPQCENIYTIV